MQKRHFSIGLVFAISDIIYVYFRYFNIILYITYVLIHEHTVPDMIKSHTDTFAYLL